MNIDAILLSFTIIFGIMIWIYVFLQTYIHFPKMEKSKRLRMSIEQATLLSFSIIAIAFLGLYISMRFFFGIK